MEAIGVTVGEGAPEMTVTLIWSAEVDLDLYYSCDDGTEVGYGAPNNCG